MTGFLYFAGAVLLVIATGFMLYKVLGSSTATKFGYSGGSPSITRTEWLAGVLIAALVIIPATSFLGAKIAKSNATTYNEFYSGLEKTATMETINCERDGSCRQTYQCDEYTVMVTKTRQVPYTTTETYTNSSGGISTRTVTRYRTETYQEPEQRWHNCPYVTQEYTFRVTDTLGETYDFGRNLFPATPESNRWKGQGYDRPRNGSGMPSLPNDVRKGIPADFQAVKDRIDADMPGGTTKRATYKNFLLASQEEFYAEKSSSVNAYLKANQLPKVQTEIHDRYRADKVYFVGSAPKNAKEWQDAVARFNGHLGSERQGDLHVIVVNAASLEDPNRYADAVEAYWSSNNLGRDTLSKNGIALILGIKGDEVAWSRGFTGMPVGNETLVSSLSELGSTAANPEALFAPESGAVWKRIMEGDSGYERVEMKNYEYLYDSVDIGTKARIFILIVAFLLSLLVWGVFLAVDVRFHPLERLFNKKAEDDVK